MGQADGNGDVEVEKVIVRYAHAHRAAEKNPRLLIEDYAKHRDGCVARMNECGLADKAVYALDGRSDLPPALAEFLAAEEDRGCAACWLSSIRKKTHRDGTPSCQAKIDRWFKAREALIRLGEELAERANGKQPA